MSRKRSESRKGYRYSEKPSKRRKKEENSRRNLKKKVIITIAVIAVFVVIISILVLLPPSPKDKSYTPLCLEFERIDKREDDDGWWTRFNVSYDRVCYDEMISHGDTLNLTFQYEFIDGTKSTILTARIELAEPPLEGTAMVYTPKFHFSKEPTSMQMMDMKCE